MKITSKHILSIAALAVALTVTIVLISSCRSGKGGKSFVDGLEYTKLASLDAYEVTGIGEYTDKELVIPSEIRGLPVRGIGEGAFADCDTVKTLKISSGVSYVADEAFTGCKSLETIKLPQTLTRIGDSAFEKCEGLVELDLGGVMHIGERAFSGCISLPEVNLPDDLVSLGDYAFYNAWRLEKVHIALGLTEISDHAFAECHTLASVSIHDSIERIGESAFENCLELYEVRLGYNLSEIGTNAFGGCERLTYAHFTNTDSWIANSYSNPSEASRTVARLHDPATAASHLNSGYADYVWGRTE